MASKKKTPVKSAAQPPRKPELVSTPVESKPPVPHALAAAVSREPDCAGYATGVNDYLARKCAAKRNRLKPCKEGAHAHDCGCGPSAGSGGASGKVDLVVLIDTSGSMSGFAKSVSDAAKTAIERAKATCPTDLRVTYLGVDGTWPGTVFNKSHRAYLAPLTTAPLSTDNPPGGLDSEEGANAIEDLSKYFDWRPEACRAIFYISDEELDSVSPFGNQADETAATNAAIAAANANAVTVFAHHITHQNRPQWVRDLYTDLCTKTGGQAFFSNKPDTAEYVKLLVDVICKACGNKCKQAKIPDYEPCISVSWGDSTCDCLETDDVEVLCITVCNCYSNLTFSGLTINFVWLLNEDGTPVANLPDGTPSVEILPPGPICFGDIPPCKDGKPGCVSRQVVLRARGAKAGNYQLRMTGICYTLKFPRQNQECFTLKLCQD